MTGRGRRDEEGSSPHALINARVDRWWPEHVLWLFREQWVDLDHRCRTAASTYETLTAAIILRSWLVESPKLIDRVRDGRNLTFRARTLHPPNPRLPPERPGKPRDRLHGICLSPDVPCHQSAEAKELTLDQWVKFEVGVLKGEPLKVIDVVKIISNSMGGAHLTKPRTVKQLHFIHLVKGIENAPPVDNPLYLLQAIGRVTLEGTSPILGS